MSHASPQQLEHVDAVQRSAEQEVIDCLDVLLLGPCLGGPCLWGPCLLHSIAQDGSQTQQGLDVSAVACTPCTAASADSQR